MKKIYFAFALVFCFAASLSAQRVVKGSESVEMNAVGQLSMNRVAVDTLFPESLTQPCGSSLVIYQSNNGGYVVGNNGYGDLAKAQKYYVNGSGTVNEVLVSFGAKTQANANSTFNASIHSVANDGSPGASTGTSDPVMMSAVDTSGNFTSFPFTVAAAVSDSFFANITLPTTAGDSVGIVSTSDPCSNGDLLWEQWSDNSWFPFTDGTNSWGLAIDAIILPVADLVIVGTDNYIQHRGLKLYGAFPNPAAAQSQIRIEMADASPVMVQVIDLQGRIVTSENFGMVNAGMHDLSLDLGNLAAGTYYYAVYVDGARVAGKINVAK